MKITATGRAGLRALGRCGGQFISVIAIALWTPHSAHAVPEATLWVVQPPGEMVAFDLGRFDRVGGIRLPVEVYRDPARIAINGLGQILASLDERRLWLWDGTAVRVLPIALDGAAGQHESAGGPPQWLLGDDGNSLVVLESVINRVGGANGNAESLIVVRETSLDMDPRDTIATWTSHHCECQVPLIAETEPCPGPRLYAAGGVVRGALALMWWKRDTSGTPEYAEGPLGQCTLSRFVRQPSGWRDIEAWSNESLPLDLAGSGAALLVEPDDGCCGWSNDSSDQLLCSSPESSQVVYDEWRRFENKDYDVSFPAGSAHLSPDLRRVALTLPGPATNGEGVRLSADGHADLVALAGIRRALASLPLTIVSVLSTRDGEVLELPHTEIVGWSNERELVVVQGRELVVVDVVTGRQRATGIRVRSAADAIVARR